jgi:hypothetical protein
MNTRALYKIKHDHVMVDGGIMLIGVIMYYIMLYMSIYFLSRFTDAMLGVRPFPLMENGYPRLAMTITRTYGTLKPSSPQLA